VWVACRDLRPGELTVASSHLIASVSGWCWCSARVASSSRVHASMLWNASHSA
jgi:hypothetical protein